MQTKTFLSVATLLWCVALFTSASAQTQSWQQTSGPYGAGAISNLTGTGDTLYGLQNYGVVRTRDGGLHWSALTNGLPTATFAPRSLQLYDYDTLILCIYNYGLYLTTDGGDSWVQWGSGGLPSGIVNFNNAYVHNQTLFVEISTNPYSSNWNLFSSTDFGTTWNECVIGNSPGALVNVLYIDGKKQAIYACMENVDSSFHVFRSVDDGLSWQTSETNLPAHYSVSTFLGVPTATTMFVEVGNLTDGLYHLYRTSDSGTTWHTFPELELLGSSINSMNGWGNLFVISYYHSSDSTYSTMVSHDGGAHWVSSASGLPAQAGAYAFNLFNNRVVASIYGYQAGQFYYDIYSGDTATFHWTRGGNLPANCSVVNYVGDNSLSKVFAGIEYLNGGNTLYDSYRTDDGGLTWTRTGTGLPPNSVHLALMNLGNSMLVSSVESFGPAGDDGNNIDLFRSTDYGNTWSIANTGLLNALIANIAIDSDGRIFASTHLMAGGYRSTDRGATWTQMQGGLPTSGDFSFAATKSGELYAGHLWNGVFKSTDHGDTWNIINSGLANTQVTCLTIGATGTIFAGTKAGMYLSKDNGQSWNASGALQLSPYRLSNMAATSGLVLAGTYTAGLFRTTDDGTTWAPANNGLATTQITGIGFSPSGSAMIGTTAGVYVSTDSGNSWSVGGNGIPTASNNAGTTIWGFVTMHDNSMIAYGVVPNSLGLPVGVFRSTDQGTSWVQYDKHISHPSNVYSMAVAPDGKVYAGTQSHSTWMFNPSPNDVGNKTQTLPSVFTMQAISPDPVLNSNANAHFSLTQPSHVDISLFDDAGHFIRQLFAGVMNSGNYDIPIESGTLASGTYFCKLTAGGRAQSQSVRIVK